MSDHIMAKYRLRGARWAWKNGRMTNTEFSKILDETTEATKAALGRQREITDIHMRELERCLDKSSWWV